MSRLLATVADAGKDQALVFHGAGGLRNGRAFLFLARSGGGKSTIAALCDAASIPMLCDDGTLVLERGTEFHIRPLPRQARVCPASVALREETRLRRVFFLEKSLVPRAEPISRLTAVAICLKENLLFGFNDMVTADRFTVLGRCIRLFRRVPAHILCFAKDDRFLDVIDALDQHEKGSPAQ